MEPTASPPGGDAPPGAGSDFAALARGGRSGLLAEMLGYLRETGKWWLVPILVVVLLMGLLIVLSGTAAAPFIYTIF